MAKCFWAMSLDFKKLTSCRIMEKKKIRNKLSKGTGSQALGSCREVLGGHTGAEGLPARSLKHMALGVHFSIPTATSSTRS